MRQPLGAAEGRRGQGPVARAAARLAEGAPGPAGVRGDAQGRPVRGRGLRLHSEGRGQVAGRAARRRSTSRTSIHTDVGHRCVGAKVNGKIVPLHYELQSGDIVEVLTSKQERGPSRDWLALVKTTRAQSKIRAWFKRERREDSERAGREHARTTILKRQGLPPQKIDRLAAARRRDPRDGLPQGGRLLHRPRPGEDLGAGRRPTSCCSGSSRARPAVEPPRRVTGLARGKEEAAKPDRAPRPATASRSRASRT